LFAFVLNCWRARRKLRGCVVVKEILGKLVFPLYAPSALYFDMMRRFQMREIVVESPA
jgi:hypothetical protein